MNHESTHHCDRLDAFLDGELSVAERHDFAAHLAACHACREAVDQQKWIDGLLSSAEAAEIEMAPPVVLPRRSRRRWMVAAAIAALAAWPWIPLPRREGIGEGRPTPPSVTAPAVATVENPSPSRSAPRPLSDLPGRGKSVATFASAGGAIAVPVAAVDAQVTVVKLYPTVTATRRWARERALLTPPSKQNGG
jgi:anti-sigma factor RsiW